MKLLKAVISGSYRTTDNEVVDFDDLSGAIPHTHEDVAIMHLQGRYAVQWIRQAKKTDGSALYPLRVESIRQVFVDSLTEAEGDLTYVGKDIREMSQPELQDLATAKDLRSIPLPVELSGASLREMRAAAYRAYAELDENEVNTDNLSRLPPLVVDAAVRRDSRRTESLDDVLSREVETRPIDEPEMSLADLKAEARRRGIPFHPNIGADTLKAKLAQA